MNYKLLNDKIRNSGMTMVAIAEKTGILRETLYNRLKYQEPRRAAVFRGS